MPHLRQALVVAGAIAAIGVSSASAAAPMKLSGTVGPGFSITLTQGGKPVKAIKAGTYTITVADKATIHNFVLVQQAGGKLSKQITGVPFTGTKTVTVKLTKGTYQYYCAPHQAAMFGNFKVT